MINNGRHGTSLNIDCIAIAGFDMSEIITWGVFLILEYVGIGILSYCSYSSYRRVIISKHKST